jgi:hypothetical protein
MKLRLAAALAAVVALVGAALLLLLPINASYSGVPIGCGTVFSPDTTKAEHTDEVNHLGSAGFKSACDGVTASRIWLSAGLGGVAALVGVGAMALAARRPRQPSMPPAAAV